MEDMNEKENIITDDAVVEYYKTGKITQACPHCRETLTIDINEYGFTILCPNGCFESLFKVL